MERTQVLAAIDALAPAEPIGDDVTFETHEQAMACTSCALAGMTPPDHFPQVPGLWDQPCPRCGEMAVWITAPRLKQEASTLLD